MLRRVHVLRVYPGLVPLDEKQSRHVRDVLRLEPGTTVEIFDDAGRSATGELALCGRDVAVNVMNVVEPAARGNGVALTVASAVPKGERADWMIEKMSELGVNAFIPVAAARSVVLPEGRNKLERWARIATESAKQSRRSGVMRIGELTHLRDAIAGIAPSPQSVGWYFSTADDARPVATLLQEQAPHSIVAFIGPEGGWTDEEIAGFGSAGIAPARLTSTVLRIETAAVAAAAVIGSLAGPA